MPSKKDFYTVARETAAETLGISTRTLDRYIKRGKLRTKSVGGRNVLIHEKDLAQFARKLSGGKSRPAKRTTHSMKREFEGEAVEVATENVEEKVFRELYEEANKDLKTKQEKLEAASFRVGQLEAQLKSSVPLLEFKQREETLRGESVRLKERLITEILKSWVFLGLAIASTLVAGILGFLMYL